MARGDDRVIGGDDGRAAGQATGGEAGPLLDQGGAGTAWEGVPGLVERCSVHGGLFLYVAGGWGLKPRLMGLRYHAR